MQRGTAGKLHEFAHPFKQESGENVWVGLVDNGGRNIKLDQAELIDEGDWFIEWRF